MRAISIGCVVALGSATPAQAAEPYTIPLAIDGPWVANYDNDSCQLLAKFGTGPDSIIARFTRYAPTDNFDLALYGEALKRGGPRSQLKIGFGPGQVVRDTLATHGTSGGKPLLLFVSQRLDNWVASARASEAQPPAIGPDQEASVTNFTLQLNRAKAYRLELGSMRRPMAEMRKCMDLLLAHWGYDPKIVATLSRYATPIGNPGNWIVSTDYPSKAVLAGHNGIVQFRLDVDETGRIAGCHILARTSPDEFADVSCRALNRRARFQPALDAAGKPVKGFYVNKVRFVA